MNLDQALRLIGMLTDTITAQQQQIDGLAAALEQADGDPDASRP